MKNNRGKQNVSVLKTKIEEIVNSLLNKETIPSLSQFMRKVYKKRPYETVHNKLWNDSFIKQQGWFRVWHEGYGEGIYSPSEGIVAVYDEDDLKIYASFHIYQFNPNTWIRTDDSNGWDKVYSGNITSEHDLESVDDTE